MARSLLDESASNCNNPEFRFATSEPEGDLNMLLAKGIGLCNLRHFLIERFGESAWDTLLYALPHEDREHLATLSDSAWYDVALHGRALRAACEVFAAGNSWLAMESGRASAERNAIGPLRFFYQFIDLPFALQHMDIYWHRENDGGRLVAYLESDRVIARLYDFPHDEPALCQSVLHYLGKTLEFFGTVASLEHPVCVCDDGKHCEFRARFQLAGNAKSPTPMMLLTPPEAMGALNEIAKTGNLEIVQRATATLMHEHLGYPYVELSVKGTSAPPIAMGTRGHGTRYRYVLDHAGKSQGLLEVELPVENTAKSTDVLGEIIPWLGIALGGCREIAQQRAASLEKGIQYAKKTFDLTKRECEVLNFLVQGKSNKEIAQQLRISDKTVEVHVSRLLGKSDVDGRGTLIASFWSVWCKGFP